MPLNTILNCVHEFKRWLPDNDVNVFYLKPSENTNLKRMDTFKNWSQAGGVFLLGYEMFRVLMSAKSVQIIEKTNILVCDEGHKIKRMDTQIMKCLLKVATKSKIVLTGYPIQINLLEYWCLINFVKPNYLGLENEFDIKFAKPIEQGNFTDSTEEEMEEMRRKSYVLSSLLSPYVHRRCERLLQSTLPEKNEFVVLFKMTQAQSELYKMVLDHAHSPVKSFATICKIMNDPNVLFNYLTSKTLDFEDADEESEDSIYDDLKHLMQGYKYEPIVKSPKMIVLLELISDVVTIGDKMLIFSQSLLTLDAIEEYVQLQFKWNRKEHYYR